MASGDTSEYLDLTDKPRKRKKSGSQQEKAKKQRVSSHETGENCLCKRLKCFEKVTAAERSILIKDFNEKYTTKNQQDAYLSSLITVCNIKRRRPRGDDGSAAANRHNHTYLYCVKTKNEEDLDAPVTKKMVCHKAFISFFGITKQRVETIRKSLVET